MGRTALRERRERACEQARHGHGGTAREAWGGGQARGLSVQARVGRHAREQRIAPSLAREDRAPQLLGQPREDVLGHRRVSDPVAVIQLCVELALTPAREAGEDALARGRIPELVDVGVVGREADPPQDDQPRRGRVLELGQHDYRARLDGPDEVKEVACADGLLVMRYGLAGTPASSSLSTSLLGPPIPVWPIATSSGGATYSSRC